MRSPSSLPLLLAALCTSELHAQTLNWGSEVFSDLVDSRGETLTDVFVFEIGAFTPGFSPAVDNIFDWYANWHVFDQANYSQANGYFTSTVEMQDNGTSNSLALAAKGMSFEGLEAFLWIRNNDSAEVGAEWLLVRSPVWIFPAPIPGCCGNEIPVEWSVSDLSPNDAPRWGNQGGYLGPGAYTVTGAFDLQTHTFVPEPSLALLLLATAAGGALRRRRAP
jgi:hypothetical protein